MIKRLIFLFTLCSITLVAGGDQTNRYCGIDPAVLTEAIGQSDKVCIIDYHTDEILYESCDADDIKWLSESFIADRNSPRTASMAVRRYYMNFYKDETLFIEIGFQKKLKFHWRGSKWDTDIDFLLTNHSYGEVLPWLCEKSGKRLNELFPVADWIIGERERPPKGGHHLYLR